MIPFTAPTHSLSYQPDNAKAAELFAALGNVSRLRIFRLIVTASPTFKQIVNLLRYLAPRERTEDTKRMRPSRLWLDDEYRTSGRPDPPAAAE